MKQCSQGHDLTPENTRVRNDGFHVCRTCNAERQRRMRAEGKVKPLTPEQKARKAAREKNRVRDWSKRVIGPEERERAAAQKRAKRAEAAWQQAYGYYLKWWDARWSDPVRTGEERTDVAIEDQSRTA